MDENNPEQVFSLLSYLQREQYGDRPLGYGQYYKAPLKTGVDSKTKKSRSYKDGSPVHSKNEKTGKSRDEESSLNNIENAYKTYVEFFSV